MTIDTDTGSRDSSIADFVAMPDLATDADEKERNASIGSDTTSLREAAERRSEPRDETTVRQYRDWDGNRAPQNESITLARATRDYSEALAAERMVVESKTSEALAARVDALRAEALAHDPGAAEFYGFESPEVEPSKDGQSDEGEASDSHSQRSATELAPEVAKALQHPQIRQAIEEQLGEVEKVRQDYIGGLSAATQITQMSFLSQFPELA